ncbi:hypothetical protein OKW35_002815 [Paraburkholderia sp. MM5477-R1]
MLLKSSYRAEWGFPGLRLDNREIVAAHLASPEQLPGFAVTGAVAAYLGRDVRG